MKLFLQLHRISSCNLNIHIIFTQKKQEMIGSPPNNQLYYIQNGSYLQFQVLATYDQIQEQLGKPNIDDDTSKVRVSWAVRHQDGRELAIWDYNQFKIPLENIMAWNAWGDITLADDLFI